MKKMLSNFGLSLVGVASFGGALVWVRRGVASRRKGKVRT